MAKFRRKQAAIEAEKLTVDNVDAIISWIGKSAELITKKNGTTTGLLITLDDDHQIFRIGDVIIKNGDSFGSRKQSDFNKEYDAEV